MPTDMPPARTNGPVGDGRAHVNDDRDAPAMIEALQRRIVALEAQLASARTQPANSTPALISALGVMRGRSAPAEPYGGVEPIHGLADDTLDYGIFVLDKTGRIASWNEDAIRIKGYGAHEIQGRDFSCFYLPEEIAAGKPQRDLEIAESNGAYQEECHCVRKNGDQFLASTMITALRDEDQELKGFAKITCDVTARKRAETHRRLMVELALNAMVLIDRQGMILQVNPQLERMFGYAAGELDGQSAEILAPPSLLSQHAGFREGYFAKPVVRAIGAGRDLYGRRKDGSHFPVEVGLNPVETDEGLLVLGSVVDITERKLAEDRARLRLTELAHAGRLSTVGEMFSGLAHEINQPLSAAANYARAGLRMARSPDGASNEQLLDWMEKAGDQVMRAMEIVKRVGTFVKKDRSTQGVVDLNRLIEEVLELPALGIGRGEGHVTPTFEGAPALPGVIADRRQIEQVVVNLVRNAVESMANTPPERRQLTIRTVAASGQVHVSVRDAGHGVTSEHMPRLFSPFFTTKDEGMGLGLSISRSIVEAHSGRLWADSQPGQGTSFHFTLPIARRETAP